jgi:pyridoxal phosphate enzyme (YggS family)
MPPAADIASNLARIRQRIADAAGRAHREPAGIILLAVSKTFEADDVRAAAAAGQSHFGENRVQEGVEKAAALTDLRVEWHLIGHLQSNKARKAAATFAWIHSVDRLDLLRRLDEAAVAAGTKPNVLLQVNLADEAQKSGADEAAVTSLARAALDARALTLSGLMIIPPIPDDPEVSRPWFRQLRELRDRLVAGGVPAASLAHLSMGMSQDFEVAIEEGATIVRVGTAIFGHRDPAAVAAG